MAASSNRFAATKSGLSAISGHPLRHQASQVFDALDHLLNTEHTRAEWLTGVTMTLLHQALDQPIHTEPVTLSDLPTMEFVFATNAATGIRPVAAVDHQSWPLDHPALKQLRDLYADIPAEQV